MEACLYVLEKQVIKRKYLTGIPLCPGKKGSKEETPYRYTFMP